MCVRGFTLKKVIFTTVIFLILFSFSCSYASDSTERKEAYNQFQEELEINLKIISKLYNSAQKKYATALKIQTHLHSVGLSTLAETVVDDNISAFLFEKCMELADNDPEIKRFLDSNGGLKAVAFLSTEVMLAFLEYFEGYRKGLDLFFVNDLQFGSMRVKDMHDIIKDDAITRLDDLKSQTEQKNVSE